MTGSDDMLRGDDTLTGGPAPPPRTREEIEALADQRLVHGLLRGMQAADAAGREARVAAILDRIGARRRRRRAVVTLAAALAVTLGAAWWMAAREERLPHARAMVEQAARELARPVDRRYSLTISLRSPGGAHDFRTRYRLTVRPGKRFLLEGQGLLGPFRMGCDGHNVWTLPGLRLARSSRPLARAPRLQRALGPFEAGFLDLQSLLESMPRSCELRSVRRLDASAGGGPMVVVQAVCRAGDQERRVEVVVEEHTGLVRRLEVTCAPEPGFAWRMTFEYEGLVSLGEQAYLRPW